MSLSFFILLGCQTKTPSPDAPTVRTLPEIMFRRLTSAGTETVALTSRQGSQGFVVTTKLGDGLAMNSQTLAFAVIGETGCGVKADCAYPEVVKSLGAEKIDFIIHTGGYLELDKISLEDNSNAWWESFYGPSEALLKTTLFLFMHGEEDTAAAGFTPSQELQIVQIGDLVLVPFDNSSFDDSPNISLSERQRWVEKFKALGAKLNFDLKKNEVWLLLHKPVVNFVPNAQDAEPEPQASALASILKEAGVDLKVDYILSGHARNQQVVLTNPQLKQFIVGHSGQALKPFGRTLLTSALVSSTESKQSFGYALFERQGLKKWTITFKSSNGQPKLICFLLKQKLNCDVAGAPTPAAPKP